MVLPVKSTVSRKETLPFLSSCQFCLQVFAPLLLAFLSLLSGKWDFPNCSLRWFLFIFYFFWGLYHFKSAFYGVILIAPWLTVPTLQLKIVNQFTYESAVLGLLVAHALRKFKKTRVSCLPTEQNWRILICHPFTLPSIFAISFTIISSVVSLAELQYYAHSQLQTLALMKSLIRSLFLWDVHGPFHSLSIISGYTIILSFFYLIIECRHQLHFSPNSLALTLCLGAIPVYLISYGQVYLPLVFNREFMVDIGGTFQNGNLLSFYSGLIIFQAVFLISKKNINFRLKIFSAVILVLSIHPLVYGLGRTTWFALALSSALGLLIKTTKQNRKILSKFCGALFFLGLAVFYIFGSNWEILKLVRSLTWDSLIFAGNRKDHYSLVMTILQENFFTGLGLGNYFIHGDRKEIHNQYLQWAIELGLGADLFLILALFFYIRYSQFFSLSFSPKKSQKDRGLALACSLLIALTLLMDHYLTYRDIAFIVGCVCLAALIPAQLQFFPSKKISSFCLFLALAAGLIQGLFTLAKPHTRPNLSTTYATETEATRTFKWHAPLMTLTPASPQACMHLELKPYYLGEISKFTAGLICSQRLPQLARLNISQLENFEKNLFYSKYFHTNSDNWQPIAFCVSASTYSQMVKNCEQGWEIYLRSDFGVYPEWTADLAHSKDKRFLSFATANLSEKTIDHSDPANLQKATNTIIF